MTGSAWRNPGRAAAAFLLFLGLVLSGSTASANAASIRSQPLPRILAADFGPFANWDTALAERNRILAQESDKARDAVTLAYAVQELKTHLEKLGTKISVSKLGANSPVNAITVEIVPDFEPMATRFATVSFGSQAYRLTNSNGQIRITAKTGVGALYGVYGLLEQLGFDWPYPDAIIVPTASDARSAMAKLGDQKWDPAQEYRGFWVISPSHDDEKVLIWMARKRFNVGPPNLPALRKMLGIRGWGGGHHLIEEVFSKKGLFERRPEFFSRIRFFKRPVASTNSQFNPAFSSKAAAVYFADMIVDRLESGDLKHFDILNVWQVDAKGRSFDESWSAWWQGNESDNILIFYSNVVDRLSEHRASGRLSRKVIIAGASYQQTMVAPDFAENARRLVGKPYLHLFYPIERDWSPLAGGRDATAINRRLMKQVDAWKSSAKLAFGLIDYHNMTRYCGLALTDYQNFSGNLAAVGNGGLAMLGFMHVARGDPGPLRLTYALSSRLGWKIAPAPQGVAPSPVVNRAVIDNYFNQRFKGHSAAWRQVYAMTASATTNASAVFGMDSSLHMLLAQRLTWEDPVYSPADVARFFTGFQKGGRQLRPGQFYGGEDYSANFVGISTSIERIGQAILIGQAELAKAEDQQVRRNMQADLLWLESALRRYRTIQLLGQYMMPRQDRQQREATRLKLLAALDELETSPQSDCTLSTVDHKEYIRQYRQIATDQTLFSQE